MAVKEIVIDQWGAVLVIVEDRANLPQYYAGRHKGCTGTSSTGHMHVVYHGPNWNRIVCWGCGAWAMVPSDVLPLIVTPAALDALRDWSQRESFPGAGISESAKRALEDYFGPPPK